MGEKERFHTAVNLIIKHMSFEIDKYVQLFEINIRVLGGLLSSHLILTDERFKMQMPNYNNELLQLAVQLGEKLIKGFTNDFLPFNLV